MALHGSININSESIGYWSAVAQREGAGEAGAVYTYGCEVTHNGRSVHFSVEHAYDDGALVLMRKMLDAAIEAM